MSFGGHIGQHRPNARVSERENSLSPQDVINQQVSHDPAVLRQGVHLLSGILTLLLIAFCYFASSVCITVVVATFLAILADPVVAVLERARIPRFFAAASIVLLGVLIFGSIAYFSYGKLADFFDDFPRYVSRIAETLSPISSKIQRVRDSAGTLANQAEPKKVPEVRIRESTSWASYLARGVGSAWGALFIAGVVPFLTFFLLIARDKIYLSLRSGAGKQMDFDRVIARANAMIRSYVAGNLVIGALMSAITATVFWQIGLAPAILLGTVSGMLNLIPFLGIVIALLIPLMAGVFQFLDTQVCRLTIGYWTRRSDDRISLLGMAVGSGRTISRSTPYGVCQTPGRCKSCDESFIESAGSGAAAGNSRKNSDHLAGLYAGQPDDQIICLVRNLNGCAYSETRLIHQ